MCFSEQELDLFAKELLRKPSKAEAYRAAFPKRCEGLDGGAIGKRAWKLAQKDEVRAKLRKFASVRDEEAREKFKGDLIDLEEFRASLTEMFRKAAVNGNVSDAVKVGGLLADVCGFKTPTESNMTIGRFDIPPEELDAILAE